MLSLHTIYNCAKSGDIYFVNSLDCTAFNKNTSDRDYWDGYEVGRLRTATQAFNNVFVLENTLDSWDIYFVNSLDCTAFNKNTSDRDYWDGYEVGRLRTATQAFNNVFVLENTLDSWTI